MIVEPPPEPLNIPIQPGVLVADEPQTIGFLEEERHVPYLELIYRETGDVITLIITLIEALNPANKVGDGREKYIQKQDDLLRFC